MQRIRTLITAHAERLNIDIDMAINNALDFAHLTGRMENRGMLIGKNPTSSAQGLYQFIKGSIEPAINRLRRYIPNEMWMDVALVHKNASRLNWCEQTLLFLGDIFEKRGSKKYTRDILESGRRDAMLNCYLELHHTDPDQETIKRATQIFMTYEVI